MSNTDTGIEQRRRQWRADKMTDAQYGQHGHAITLCDATTGHSVTAVAFCDDDLRAESFCRAVNHHEAIVNALEGLLDDMRQQSNLGDGQFQIKVSGEKIRAARAVLQAVKGMEAR